ncbi:MULTISPECIES: hypothetical protein [Actinotignum]|uniref:hypothetical protein n=1 Tax=Actinotignum TaxID=1653174 RepID=UPI00255029BB|nr:MULTISPECIES: hypothetical protein [Actinotignum]MDK7271850.1 hypothetical protein [Actinotignum schaalii]MDY5135425.1 hypothetical protein [Actinotignum timonense]
MKTIRKVGAAFAATLLSIVAFMPSASAIQVGGYKKCNFNQAHVGVYAKQQTSEYMVVKVRSDVLYNEAGRFEVSVVSNHFNGNWSAAAPELLRAPTHATCTPIDW